MYTIVEPTQLLHYSSIVISFCSRIKQHLIGMIFPLHVDSICSLRVNIISRNFATVFVKIRYPSPIIRDSIHEYRSDTVLLVRISAPLRHY